MRQLDEQVWAVEQDEHFMPGGIHMPLRMTVVRLPSGGLWLHSPVPVSEAEAEAIEALGPVAHLVAPSRMHDLHVAALQARWPEAQLWAPEGLQKEGWRVDGVLTEGARWEGVIEAVSIDGAPKVQEVVFVHEPSRTLVVTDLLFHFQQARNAQTGCLLSLIGARGRLAMSRSWRWIFVRDKPATAASIERVLARDFDRIVVCHGAVREQGGRAALEETTAWLRS